MERRTGDSITLYFHGGRSRPVLELKQSLPEAFTALPKPGIKKGNVVAMPGRSWQGSRRRFWLGRSGAQFKLQVELHEQVLVFAVHGRLPNRNHSVVKAQLQQQGNSMDNNVDEGTCEIVEKHAKGSSAAVLCGKQNQGPVDL